MVPIAIPAVFFTHFSKSWPHLFGEFDLRALWRTVKACDANALLNWLVMSEIHHQFALKNTTWFMECCHREGPDTLGSNAMVLLGTEDAYVDGPATAKYLARYHPAVRVHLSEGWAHGAFWDPANLETTMAQLRAFLCTDCDENQQPAKAAAVKASPQSVRAAFLRRA